MAVHIKSYYGELERSEHRSRLLDVPHVNHAVGAQLRVYVQRLRVKQARGGHAGKAKAAPGEAALQSLSRGYNGGRGRHSSPQQLSRSAVPATGAPEQRLRARRRRTADGVDRKSGLR